MESLDSPGLMGKCPQTFPIDPEKKDILKNIRNIRILNIHTTFIRSIYNKKTSCPYIT